MTCVRIAGDTMTTTSNTSTGKTGFWFTSTEYLLSISLQRGSVRYSFTAELSYYVCLFFKKAQ